MELKTKDYKKNDYVMCAYAGTKLRAKIVDIVDGSYIVDICVARLPASTETIKRKAVSFSDLSKMKIIVQ